MIGGELAEAVARFRRVSRRALRGRAGPPPFGNAEIELIVALIDDPGQTVAAIAARLGLAPNTVSTLVTKAVADGWLLRQVDPADRRAARLYPSDAAAAKDPCLARRARRTRRSRGESAAHARAARARRRTPGIPAHHRAHRARDDVRGEGRVTDPALSRCRHHPGPAKDVRHPRRGRRCRPRGACGRDPRRARTEWRRQSSSAISEPSAMGAKLRQSWLPLFDTKEYRQYASNRRGSPDGVSIGR